MDWSELQSLLNYDPETGEFRWRVDVGGRSRVGAVAGTLDHEGYIIIRYRGKGYKAHRLAWFYVTGQWPSNVIDHLNRVKSDNRFDNLRDTTNVVNANNVVQANQGSASGVRNVSWFAQYQKWKVSYQVGFKRFFVGHFDTVAEAAAARDAHRSSNPLVQQCQ